MLMAHLCFVDNPAEQKKTKRIEKNIIKQQEIDTMATPTQSYI